MRILVIDDKIDSFREALADALPDHDLRFAPDGESGLFYLGQDADVSLVLLDIKMPPKVGQVEEREGIEVLKKIHDSRPDLPVVMLSVFTDVDLVIEAIREGAFHYIVKPFTADKLRSVVGWALSGAELGREVDHLRGVIDTRDRLMRMRQVGKTDRLGDIVGGSEAMRRLYADLECFAPNHAPILITGESGTGKELIAKEIHRLSPRAKKQMVIVNTAAIAPHLLESELFGHVRGAFTHAFETRDGRIAEADGGTLFLDEIGEMPLDLQVKLLRVLQDKVVQPVGGGSKETRKSDFRLVCATNRNLPVQVAQGKFREDLYYRINVLPLEAPPLRERRDDLELLAAELLGRYANGLSPQYTSTALQKINAHDWPGNVRELENVLIRALALARGGPIGPEHIVLPESAMTPPSNESAADGKGENTLWDAVRAGRLRVADLGAFKKQHGDAGLRDVLLGALTASIGNYKKAMVMIGYSESEDDERKHAAFRQAIKRLNLGRAER